MRWRSATGRRQVAEAVVDHLETIEVEEEHGERDSGFRFDRSMASSSRSMKRTRLGRPVKRIGDLSLR